MWSNCLLNRRGLLDRSGSSFEARRILDPLRSTDPLEETLERVGEDDGRFEHGADANRERDQESMLEKAG